MSNNRTPEEQAAYKEQLQAQLNEVNAELDRLTTIQASHQAQVDRYTKFETDHPVFKVFVQRMIGWTESGMMAIRQQIAEYQGYKDQYIKEFKTIDPDFQG